MPTWAAQSRLDSRRKTIPPGRPPRKDRGLGPETHPSTKALGQLSPSGPLVQSEQGEAGPGCLWGSWVWPWLSLKGEGLPRGTCGHPRPREGQVTAWAGTQNCPHLFSAAQIPDGQPEALGVGSSDLLWACPLPLERPYPGRRTRKDRAVRLPVWEVPEGAHQLAGRSCADPVGVIFKWPQTLWPERGPKGQAWARPQLLKVVYNLGGLSAWASATLGSGGQKRQRLGLVGLQIHTPTHGRTRAHTHMGRHTCTRPCPPTSPPTQTHKCASARTHVHAHTRIRRNAHTYLCAHAHAHMHMHAHMHL